MIIKESMFPAFNSYGEPVVRLLNDIGTPGLMEKTAGVHPEILAYKMNLTPDPNKTYVHIIALGAGEYYGANLNNDYFPWKALAHDHTTTPHEHIHGYKTFLNAHAFAHHVNKDPEKAYGDVLLSVLNHKMKRVELIVAIDNEKCIRNGGSKTLERINNGEFPSTSMGCRVPYDTCSICGNKAKTRVQYCDHMKTEAGKIYADGRKVFVYNDYPRFFDISFVFIGADRTSFVLEKIASIEKTAGDAGLGKNLRKNAGTVQEKLVDRIPRKVERQDRLRPRPMSFGKINTMLKRDKESKAIPLITQTAFSPRNSLLFTNGSSMLIRSGDTTKKIEGGEMKTASFKFAETSKHSDIFKDVDATPMGKAVKILAGTDEDLPKPILNAMASEGDLGSTLSQAAGMGIILKPKEFQRVILTRSGQPDLADDLEDDGTCFDSHDEHVPVMRSVRIIIGSTGGVTPNIASMLAPILQARSALTPFATRRMITITAVPKPSNGCGCGGDDDSYSEDDSYDDSSMGGCGCSNAMPILQKIASMYHGYRQDVLENMETLISDAYNSGLKREIEKTRGGSYNDDEVIEKIASFAIPYFSNAYWSNPQASSSMSKFASFSPKLSNYLLKSLANK
jgi:hypothetical protein